MIQAIIPYRNREENLENTLGAIGEWISPDKVRIIEQEEGLPFNKGALINFGMREAEAEGATAVWVHDVDMIPVKVDLKEVGRCVRLASRVSMFKGKDLSWGLPYFHYYGASLLLDMGEFKRVNGYSNRYWGWGGEDDDFGFRVGKWGGGWEHREGVFFHQKHRRESEHPGFEGRNTELWESVQRGKVGNEEGIKQLGEVLEGSVRGEKFGRRTYQVRLRKQ